MQTLATIGELRAALDPLRYEGRAIGLVPTMGALHHGHMALVDRSRAANGATVVSIFVNPTQFGPNEDFATYPRDLDRDLELCQAHGVDFVFAPGLPEMYPEPMDTFVEVASLSGVLVGAQRPGHFRGVATVVSKLLHIAEPERAYFGEKDFQQLAVIRRMVRDLSMRVEIVGVPTVREPDGLAASSRNVRLSPEARAAAPAIGRALDEAEARFRAGERSAAELVELVRSRIAAAAPLEPVAVDFCSSRTLEPLETIGSEPAVILVSVRAEKVLLIDQRELISSPETGKDAR
ncbi:pantoate--beta-alanine ligase [Aureimonas leprariae]|uniref:Pantothenate synthetase n=1 Tax=Plantimonas leprariae TaxID=2615207 RepID=A0A7V7PPX2_9HYPH|nr:pantoate--beta-alanine ligase [Aureimonas leprariae]KAB0680148.1 pantoate--beta-alanine ligase [Aureimonas leprariae]